MQAIAIDIFYETMNRKIANPTTLIFAVFVICTAALVVFGQENSRPSQGLTTDELFKYIGYVSLSISALAVATAAVYTTLRKSALAEWKELAESRKGKLAERDLEIHKLTASVSRLEADNEELEKKNLRLQDERKG